MDPITALAIGFTLFMIGYSIFQWKTDGEYRRWIIQVFVVSLTMVWGIYAMMMFLR